MAAPLRGRRLRRPRPAIVIAALAVALGLGGGWLWLRDSSLVAVTRVTVTGARGPDAARIRSALAAAARSMTTLDVRLGVLHTAVAPYPVVRGLRVSTQFPHGLRIAVLEQVPVAALSAGGHTIAVAADGTLLHDVATAGLTKVVARVLPGGTSVLQPGARAAVAMLAAAPAQLRGRVVQVSAGSAHGLVAQLRSGPSIYFGDASELGAKWAAAAAVLGDHGAATSPGSAGASYIDVTDPARPAAGAG